MPTERRVMRWITAASVVLAVVAFGLALIMFSVRDEVLGNREVGYGNRVLLCEIRASIAPDAPATALCTPLPAPRR